MRTYPFLLGSALLFWGWETGLWLPGLIMAVVIEGSRFVRVRWDFTDTDLNRICDLCWVLFLGAGLILYSTEDRMIFIFKFAQWMPMAFFPIMLAQAYGNREAMPLSVFSWLLRRTKEIGLARKSFNISYAYFAICLMAVSASNRPNGMFYWGMCALVLGALTTVRPQRVSRSFWVGLLIAVMFAGEVSQQELRVLQSAMEGALGGWLAGIFGAPQDSRECRTSIGREGNIKLSNKILLRVRALPGEIPPPLLRETAYDSYKSETWWATSNEFVSVPMSGSTNDMLKLLPPKAVGSVVEIAEYLPQGMGIIALPHGTFEVGNFPAVARTNRLGVTDVQSGQGLMDVYAHYGGGRSLDGPPLPSDLVVPENEKPALAEVVRELQLNEMTDRQRIRAVSLFFRENFKYSLRVPRRSQHWTPLAQFLMRTRAGHCEYFGTATVLLLRMAGVPARYVAGYAVPESALSGGTYYIRERHQHAWALVYHSDTKMWEQLDTTPSGWAETESTPWYQAGSDFFSNLYFQFSKWRWGKTSIAHYAEWFLAPLILYLVVRIVTSQRGKPTTAGAEPAEPAWPGLDSELFLINRRLADVHLSRQPQEPLATWQRRLEEAFPTSAELRRIFQLHRRLRFDPIGLESHDRQILRREAEDWLAEHAPPASRAR
ncbi:MAG TPA: transglutaminase domain-containing protein [Verrucomicrobiae bacterium]|jgi:hypothetical protein